MSAVLPPIPDVTGEPRPPTPPRLSGRDRGARAVTSEHRPDGSLVTAERGDPVLERAWSPRPRRVLFSFGAALGGALLPIVTGAVYLATSSPSRVTVLVVIAALVALVACLAVMFLRYDARHVLQAGARGVAMVDGAGRGVVVDSYLLRAVDVVQRRTGPSLVLTESATQQVWIPVHLLEGNRALWALVYNGIRYSAERGAAIDARTRERLALPPAAHAAP